MSDLVEFLRARLDEQRSALIRLRDGHEGPCLNYADQPPEEYDEYDSCYLHIKVSEATPYSDAAYGLAEVEAKRRIVEQWAMHEALDRETFDAEGEHARSLVSLRAAYWDACRELAAVYADHPDYRPEWAPAA